MSDGDSDFSQLELELLSSCSGSGLLVTREVLLLQGYKNCEKYHIIDNTVVVAYTLYNIHRRFSISLPLKDIVIKSFSQLIH